MRKGSRIQKEKTNNLEEELMKVKIMKEIWTLCLRQIAFIAILLSIADCNGVFEGGPYFYNQVGLFIKP